MCAGCCNNKYQLVKMNGMNKKILQCSNCLVSVITRYEEHYYYIREDVTLSDTESSDGQ